MMGLKGHYYVIDADRLEAFRMEWHGPKKGDWGWRRA